jgi:hypothetical protein
MLNDRFGDESYCLGCLASRKKLRNTITLNSFDVPLHLKQ